MTLFVRRDTPAVLGVLHLPPLPGAPAPGPGLDQVIAGALRDARALQAGGADGVIVENLGDAPFLKQDVAPVTIAAMTRVVRAVVEACPSLSVGINVLRNDALGALAIAAVTGAAFVRVNVLVGAMVTDQGLIEGRARDVAIARRDWAPAVRVAADVQVKHAASLGPRPLADVARDTWTRGGADALIVSGSGTGAPTSRQDLEVVRAAAREAPVWLGSGYQPDQAEVISALTDVVIVGTWLHRDADLRAPLDPARIDRVVRSLRG